MEHFYIYFILQEIGNLICKSGHVVLITLFYSTLSFFSHLIWCCMFPWIYWEYIYSLNLSFREKSYSCFLRTLLCTFFGFLRIKVRINSAWFPPVSLLITCLHPTLSVGFHEYVQFSIDFLFLGLQFSDWFPAILHSELCFSFQFLLRCTDYIPH